MIHLSDNILHLHYRIKINFIIKEWFKILKNNMMMNNLKEIIQRIIKIMRKLLQVNIHMIQKQIKIINSTSIITKIISNNPIIIVILNIKQKDQIKKINILIQKCLIIWINLIV